MGNVFGWIGRIVLVLAVLLAGLFTAGGHTWANGAEEGIDGPPLALPTSLVPVPGSRGVFTITERSRMDLMKQTGFFSSAPFEQRDIDTRAVQVQYTILPVGERGAEGTRIFVKARPIDPVHHTPIRTSLWEGVYVLVGGVATPMAGTEIPADYEDLIAPEWLADWALTAPGQLPQDQLSAGSRWESVPNFYFKDWDDIPFDEMNLPLTGEFKGWVDVSDTFGPAAHIAERVRGRTDARKPLSDFLAAMVSYDVEIAWDYWLIPDSFPFAARRSLSGVMDVVVGPDSGAPEGVEGRLYYDFRYERRFQWQPADAFPMDE